MSKLRFCLKTSCWLFMGLAVALPIRADTSSSMVFCEMANSCVILDKKNDPNFNSIFENTVENVLQSTIKATIISVTPMKLPQGSTVEVTVTAPNAHFNTGSIGNVSVGEGAITVNPGGTVLSPTKIRLSVTVPSNLALGFYDMTVITELSDKTEAAAGKGVLQVVVPSGNPEILSITPSNVPKPLSNYVLSVYGQNTNFSNDSKIDFGDSGITGTVKTVHNNNFMEVYIDVSDDAQKGIHNVKVTTGDEVAKLNIPMGIPLVYEFNKKLKPVRHYYLASDLEVKKAIARSLKCSTKTHLLSGSYQNILGSRLMYSRFSKTGLPLNFLNVLPRSLL